MNLWIRSQDKEKLIKENNIHYSAILNKDHNISDDRYILGTYKSKERALEILDEIQNYINGIKKDWNMAIGDFDKTIDNSKVYEMPSE